MYKQHSLCLPGGSFQYLQRTKAMLRLVKYTGICSKQMLQYITDNLHMRTTFENKT